MCATPRDSTPEKRLTEVEMLLSHLQHDVDKLNEALLGQQSQIDDIRLLVTKVQSIVDNLPDESPDPTEERPPHY